MIPFLLFQITSSGIDVVVAVPTSHLTVAIGAEPDTMRVPGMVDTVFILPEIDTVRVL